MKDLFSLGQIRQGYQHIVARVELNRSWGRHGVSFKCLCRTGLRAHFARARAPHHFITDGTDAACPGGGHAGDWRCSSG